MDQHYIWNTKTQNKKEKIKHTREKIHKNTEDREGSERRDDKKSKREQRKYNTWTKKRYQTSTNSKGNYSIILEIITYYCRCCIIICCSMYDRLVILATITYIILHLYICNKEKHDI
jgi:hypothetical protein